MNQPRRTLRTVADFAAIPAGQRPQCLRAFQQWLREQTDPASASEFVFGATPASAPRVTRTAGLHELGLRPAAVTQFRAMGICMLQDFTRFSLAQIRCVANVGPATIDRVRELLHCAGLDLRAGEEPAGRPAAGGGKAARRQVSHLTDDVGLADVNLNPTTLRRLLHRSVHTIGDFRRLTPAQIAGMLTIRRRLEVFSLLRVRGLSLSGNPSECELWKHGLLRREDLRKPEEEHAVWELEPWLRKTLTAAVARAGCRTVGELRELASAVAARQDERGIGAYSWMRIRKYFGLPPHPRERRRRGSQ